MQEHGRVIDPMITELFNMMNTLLKKQDAIQLTIEGVQESFSQHTADEASEMRSLSAAVAKFSDAFPKGDTTGHRMYHEATINKLERRAAFWDTMYKELAKYGLIGFCGWAIYALWDALLRGHR